MHTTKVTRVSARAGFAPAGKLTRFYGGLLYAATAMALPAQTYTTLASFDGTDGTSPSVALVQATNGDLYGTTYGGGTNPCPSPGCGTIFKITPNGTLTTVYSFCSLSGCTDGANPGGALVQAANGDFYGTTLSGGASDNGTVFKISPSGTLTTVYSFCSQAACTDGATPGAALVQAANGEFYSTTAAGGANGEGTVFKITPGGALATLYSFCSQSGCIDGKEPYGGLVQASNGDFYGTAWMGGTDGFGTVFKITPSGTLTTLHSFAGPPTDGENPLAVLVQASNGDLYGTTSTGGTNNDGTVFKITPSGTLMTLYSFCSQSNCTDGASPTAGLVQATNGELYGTTQERGANGKGGTIFKISPGGTLTTLYSFCSQSGCADGGGPYAGLVQDTDGDFYGAAEYHGANGNYGTVFSLAVGLGPFVETQPVSGQVGAVVKILGTDLTGTTSVTFDGTPAAITFVSASEISTTVPVGATSGTVEVVTPRGTLSSNVPFRVLP